MSGWFAHAVVRRARACVGARFRAQGRAIETGLDCIGVVAMAWDLRRAVRADYRLRARGFDALEGELARVADRVPPGDARAGDALVVDAGGGQPHVVLLTPDGYVHAEAGMRRVVETPGAVAWPVRSAWRLADDPARTGEDG